MNGLFLFVNGLFLFVNGLFSFKLVFTYFWGIYSIPEVFMLVLFLFLKFCPYFCSILEVHM